MQGGGQQHGGGGGRVGVGERGGEGVTLAEGWRAFLTVCTGS